MRVRWVLIAAAMFAIPMAAAAQTARFDGSWNVLMTCPPHNDDDEAKGYTHRFPAEVANGQLRGVHGLEGEPGWHLLTGQIAEDGSATLRLEGIVNSPDHAINNAQRGKAYRYTVRAKFEPSSGLGQRLSGRVCQFRFTR